MAPSCACSIDACVLCEARLYPGLTPEQVCQIRGHLIPHVYHAHEVLCREGEPATLLFVLRTGQVKLTTSLPDGRQQIFRLAVGGQFLGLKIGDGQKYPYTAEALTDVNVCKINLRDLMQVLESNPAVSLRIIQSLGEELDEAEAHIRDLGLKTAPEKVATFILSLIPAHGDRTQQLPLVLSRREMAEMLGLTEETTSRVMADFSRKKIIEAGKGFIRILNHPSLQTLAGITTRPWAGEPPSLRLQP